MSLRVKFAIGMVALAAAATIVVGSVTYFSMSGKLRSEVDSSLVDAARQYGNDENHRISPNGNQAGAIGNANPSTVTRSGPAGSPTTSVAADGDDLPGSFDLISFQEIDVTGQVVRNTRNGLKLPVSAADVAVADGSGPASDYAYVTIDGVDYRMYTVRVPEGAHQFARSVTETERILDSIRNRTLGTVLLMSLLALIVGWVIAQQVTRKLVRLTEVAAGVAESGDLDVEVPVGGSDETGRLGKAFSEMLASLHRARTSQYQLVQDASHELRTPLTSLRTNVSVMQRFDELSPASRQQLLADVESETRELTELVNELVQLATDSRDDEAESSMALADLARMVVGRAERRTGRTIVLDADEAVAVVRPQAIDRAMTNLVANALKFSEGDIEVRLHSGRFEVLDRGPGIAPDDLPHIFDRFHRSVQARALPGSGLGLAIVRDVVERHGGRVFAANRPDGGAVIGFTIPLPAPDLTPTRTSERAARERQPLA